MDNTDKLYDMDAVSLILEKSGHTRASTVVDRMDPSISQPKYGGGMVYFVRLSKLQDVLTADQLALVDMLKFITVTKKMSK